MNTTTIEITESQKEQLDTLKRGEKESYKEVLQRIIERYRENGENELTKNQVRQIARETVNDMVLPRALE